MTITLNEVKSKLDKFINLACDGGENIIISKDEKRGVVIISIDEHESLKEIKVK
jgi:prevent-host-death family protein